ncbi:Protein-disulfide isomerase [Jatrophihabitans endophyticus]|uniref:Protein-disulfide isomerase n=1 Tax=Jatrophihabitans endophyticus TaxID=1206085 RepID=A0A1M5RXL4_9ACTN|nr:Protein-disulfide isomerase [Jatrophihabitans endophyticus]
MSVRWLSARPWLGTVIRLFLGVVWIWASWSKLHSPRTFVQAVRAYDATPEWLAKAIGYGLPVLEFCLGLALILGLVVRVAAVVSAVLFFVFLVGLVQAAARGISLDCGCFGGGGTTDGGTSYTLDILRDVGLLLLAAFLVLWPLTRLSIDEFIARHDYVEPPSAKRLRSEQGRRKYNALLEARRKEAQSRNRWVAASTAGVVVLVALIGIGVQSGRAKVEGSLTATNASVANGVVYGKKAAATVDVYEDFQCPNCRDYEERVGKTMQTYVQQNKAQVRYHMISLSSLDSEENGHYSSRGANAGYCASDISVDFFHTFHTYMFQTKIQPAEGAGGIADSMIIADATKAGLPAKSKTDFTSCVTDNKHKALVQAVTDRSSQDGVSGTPTIKVNGKTIGNSLSDFTAAVAKAAKNGPAPSPSPTKTPTPTKASTPAATPASSAKSSAKP